MLSLTVALHTELFRTGGAHVSRAQVHPGPKDKSSHGILALEQPTEKIGAGMQEWNVMHNNRAEITNAMYATKSQLPSSPERGMWQ
jgi:hypothetical protein